MKWNTTTVFLALFGAFIVACLACNMSSSFTEAMSQAKKNAQKKAQQPQSKHSKKAKQPVPADKYCPNSKVIKTAGRAKDKTNCYGFCPADATEPNGSRRYKTDKNGSNCYGMCVDNVNVPKKNKAGTNCYGYCGDNSNIYMKDPMASNCLGYCKNGVAKLDRRGTNCPSEPDDPPADAPFPVEGFEGRFKGMCRTATGEQVESEFGCCPDGTSKVDAEGTNCTGSANYTCKSSKGDVMSAYGCCADGEPMTDATGKNCAGAVVCNYGMCADGMTCKSDEAGSNCAVNGTTTNKTYTCTSATGTVVSAYGCCSDGSPYTDASGKNCAAAVACNFGFCPDGVTCRTDSMGSNCAVNTGGTTYSNKTYTCSSASGPVASAYGCCSDGTPYTDATGTNCAAVVACNYGKCTDGITCKADSVGSNCSQYPPPLPMSCESSMYGCCPDNVTTKNMEGSNCNVQPNEMGAGVQPYSTSTVFIPPPSGVLSSTSTVSSAPSCPEPAPCPSCARCPEPAFQCKKVPNYERTDNERYVPQAVLTDFSSFGM